MKSYNNLQSTLIIYIVIKRNDAAKKHLLESMH